MSGDFDDESWPEPYGREAVASAAAEIEAVGQAVRSSFDADRFPSGLPLLDPGNWAGQLPPPREWLLRDWIPARQATYLTGPGSAGKSLIAQQLCTCTALGLPFMGVETRQSVAMYLTCEDDEAELYRRQHAICEAVGAKLGDLSGKLHLVSLAGHIGTELATFGPGREPVDECDRGEPSMRLTNQWRALSETAQDTGAGFIALDNVAHLFAGNENIRNEVAAFVSLLNRLAMQMDGAVLLIGHPNKAGDSYSGSTAWENQVRARLFLETPKDDDGYAVDPDARVLSRQKSNYARNGETIAFRWHRMAYVRDEDLPGDFAAELNATIRATSENARFLDCLRARSAQGEGRGVGPSPSSNYAPAQFEAMREARGLKKVALRRAMERLFATGAIETYEHRNTEKGRTVTLIREVGGTPERSPERLPNTIPDHPRTHTPNDPAHTLYTYGNKGAGPEAAAPSDSGDEAGPEFE